MTCREAHQHLRAGVSARVVLSRVAVVRIARENAPNDRPLLVRDRNAGFELAPMRPALLALPLPIIHLRGVEGAVAGLFLSFGCWVRDALCTSTG